MVAETGGAGARAELLILYGSQTGAAQEVAEQVEAEAVRRRFAVRCLPMDAYPLASLPSERLLVTICSTTGQGDPPDNMRAFWQFLRRRDLPASALAHVCHACFGLGDSSYPKFNVVARRLAARLAQLGSGALAPAGYGDEQDELGTEQALQPWLSALWDALDRAAPMPPGLAPLGADTPPPLRFVLAPAGAPRPGALAPAWTLLPPAPPAGTDARSPLLARVSANVQLSAAPAERDVRHLELLVPFPNLAGPPGGGSAEASAAHADALLARARALPPPHAPGDSLGVWPLNSDAAVRRCLARLRRTAPAGSSGAEAFDGDALVEVLCSEADAATGALTRPLPPGPLPLRELLRTYVDLSAPPGRRFCAALARCTDEGTAEGAAQAARLREFAAPSGQALLREYAGKPRRSALEVLDDFEHGRPDLPSLLSLLSPMAPRFYSIASEAETAGVRLLAHSDGADSLAAAQAVQLCVAVLRYRTFLRDEREGLCSAFLAGLQPHPAAALAAAGGAAVDARDLPCARVWFRAGALRLPADERAPLLMVGPGTGVAPFRAFVQRRCRLALAAPPVPAAPPACALFFGCRSARLDHLYASEWAAAHDARVLARVPVAFSRDGARGAAKTYVQTVLARPEMAALVRELLARGAHVYVAGAAGAMPRDVRQALCEAVRGGGASEAETEAAVRALEQSGRYQVEVWG